MTWYEVTIGCTEQGKGLILPVALNSLLLGMVCCEESTVESQVALLLIIYFLCMEGWGGPDSVCCFFNHKGVKLSIKELN